MPTTSNQVRTTKYSTAVRAHIDRVGHATNAELLEALRVAYPRLSATTVHRITSRMIGRKELLLAPVGADNVLRFDANNVPHDHFMCMDCGVLRDTNLDDEIRRRIERSVGKGCSISGNLVVSGLCKICSMSQDKG